MADFSDVMNQIGQVLGTIGGNVISAINTVGAIEHGGLPQMLANQDALRQDPAFRATVNQPGFLSALHGGMAGLGFPSYAPDPNVQSAGYGNQGQLIGPTVNTALPPMTPQAQAEQAKAVYEAKMRSMTPEQAVEYARSQGISGPAQVTIPTGSGMVRVGGGAAQQPLEFPTMEAAQAAGSRVGLVPVPTNRNTFVLRQPARPQGGGFASPADAAAILGGGGQAPPQAAPEPQPTPTEAPAQPEPFQLPPGFVPFEGSPAVAQPTAPQAPATAQAEPRIGYPSPAFTEGPSIVKNPQTMDQFERTQPTIAQGRPVVDTPGAAPVQMAQAAPAAAPPGLAPTPVTRSTTTVKLARGITQSITREAPKASTKEDFSQLAAKRVLPLISRATQAIDNLTQKGVLRDDYIGIIGNRARLEYESRKPNADPDAVFLLRNLKSAVPLLARGFGEQRTNIQEEKRLADAFSFNFMSASAARSILDNYRDLFETGTPPPLLQQTFPGSAQTIQGQFQQSLTPEQQRILQQSQPMGR